MMSNHFCVWFFLAIVSQVSTQTFFPLSSLASKDFPYSVGNRAEIAVFVSASADNNDLLAQIIVSSRDGNTASLLELKNMQIFKNTDLKYGWKVNGPVHFRTSSVKEDQLKALTGVVYVTDVNDDYYNLSIYDINKSGKVSLKDSITTQTVVFLNTNYDKSTQITNWKQKFGQKASLYLYEPGNSENVSIFNNPVTIGGIPNIQFINNVESFSINALVFHGIFVGGVQFNLAPGSIDQSNSETNSFTTTGLITKSKNEKDSVKIIKISGNESESNKGISGFNAWSIVNPSGLIQTEFTSNKNVYPSNLTSANSYSSFVIKNTSDQIKVLSTNCESYYIQFFNVAVS